MRKILTKRTIYYLSLFISSALLGIGIVRTDSISGQTVCTTMRICETEDHMSRRGTAINTERGFPVVYHQTKQFVPNDQGRYAEAGLDMKNSPLMAIMNIVFWYALLDLIGRMLQKASKRIGKK